MSQAEETQASKHKARTLFVSGIYDCIECGIKLTDKYATFCFAQGKVEGADTIYKNDLVCDECLADHLPMCALAN